MKLGSCVTLVSAFGLGICSSARGEGSAAGPARLASGAPAVGGSSLRPSVRALPPPGAAARGRARNAATVLDRVEAANRRSAREPLRETYSNATQVYSWSDGAVYRLYAAPERVSDIALQPGEKLISVAAGDTARWIVGDTASGSGAERRTHILVKPSSSGLRTNLLISTDRRVYHVQLESNLRTAMAGISWTYPADALLAVRPREESPPAGLEPAGIALEALNFDYRIEGDEPPWRPLRAFDDGSQVFIQFPPTLAEGEAPPLFVRGRSGAVELVNYRLRGYFYVVDRLFAEAELRLGERRQQVVRIVRGGSGAKRRRDRAS